MPTVTISDRWVRSVKLTPNKYVDYWDSLTRGFGCRVSPDGSKTWNVVCRKGKGGKAKKRHTIGCYPDMLLNTARNRAKDLLDDFRRDDTPAHLTELRSQVTFGMLADLFIEEHSKLKKKSWRDDSDRLARRALPAWEQTPAGSIKTRDVLDLLAELKLHPFEHNRTKSLISMIYKHGIKQKLVDDNPASNIEQADEGDGRKRYYNEDEIRRIWAALDHLSLVVRNYYRFELTVGQRGGSKYRTSDAVLDKEIGGITKEQLEYRQKMGLEDKGEVLFMEWSEIDFHTALWTIPERRTKNKREHVVPLMPEAVKCLTEVRAYQKARGVKSKYVWVMLQDGKTVRPLKYSLKRTTPPSYMRTYAQQIRVLSGIADFRMHDLRRTMGTMLTSGGVEREDVAKLLNHASNDKNRDVTSVYDRFNYLTLKQDVVAFWAVKLRMILAKENTTTLHFPAFVMRRWEERMEQERARVRQEAGSSETASTPTPQTPPKLS